MCDSEMTMHPHDENQLDGEHLLGEWRLGEMVGKGSSSELIGLIGSWTDRVGELMGLVSERWSEDREARPNGRVRGGEETDEEESQSLEKGELALLPRS